ncbi:MAG TPA: hypothetical protein VGJ67_04550 [Actinomycetota bacterium]
MRRLTVIGGTLIAMVAAAGVGAFVAAHSAARDAPSVGAPDGATPPSDGVSPKGQAARWDGVMVSRTSRGYRSGGTCTTDWRTTLRLMVDTAGEVSGSGTAKLTSGPSCPFVTGQPQLHRFDMSVAGSSNGKVLDVHLAADPHGNGIDYGGFDEAFRDGRMLSIAASGDTASLHQVVRVVPADPTDTAIARNSIRLRQRGA